MGTIAEKLIYLNETKEELKDSINNIGGNITNETTFREYAQELDNIYDNLPKTSGTGTNLSLTTLKGKLKFNEVLLGDTQQDTTTGKNLFKDIPTQTLNGITLTNNGDGSYTFNGTSTAYIRFIVDLDSSIASGTALTIYAEANQDNINVYVEGRTSSATQEFFVSNISTSRAENKTITNAITKVDIAFPTTGTVLNNFIIKPMLVKGTYTTSTILPFEKFTRWNTKS